MKGVRRADFRLRRRLFAFTFADPIEPLLNDDTLASCHIVSTSNGLKDFRGQTTGLRSLADFQLCKSASKLFRLRMFAAAKRRAAAGVLRRIFIDARHAFHSASATCRDTSARPPIIPVGTQDDHRRQERADRYEAQRRRARLTGDRNHIAGNEARNGHSAHTTARRATRQDCCHTHRQSAASSPGTSKTIESSPLSEAERQFGRGNLCYAVCASTGDLLQLYNKPHNMPKR